MDAVWTVLGLAWATVVLAFAFLSAWWLWERSRARYWLRLGWYRLTKRMPGKCPRRDLYRLSVDDAIAFGKIAGRYADEPRFERRRM